MPKQEMKMKTAKCFKCNKPMTKHLAIPGAPGSLICPKNKKIINSFMKKIKEERRKYEREN